MSDPRDLQHPSPCSWISMRAKFLFRDKRVVGFPDEEPLSASQRFGVVPQRFLEEQLDSRFMAAFKGQENFKLVEPEDFVISLRSFQGGIEHSRFRGIISPAYTVMAADGRADPRFFRHCLKDRGFVSRLNAVITGIRDGKTIRYEEFAELELPLPPLPTQRAIADFLDRKTAAIDALIGKKVKLLELLAEKRAALINQAVTKGLDPDVPMKDSGIPWIGEVPRHWAVSRLGYLSAIKTGGTPPRSDESYFGGSIPWVRTTEVRGKYISTTEHHLRASGLAASNCEVFPTGTVVVAMYGQGLTRGRAAILATSAATNQACAAILPTDQIAPELIWAALCAGYWALRSQALGGQQPNLNLQMVSDFRIPVPPRVDQPRLLDFIRKCHDGVSETVVRVEQQLDRLREYRQALITAAVTGQLEIPEEAA